jgi:hypothetical protein
MKQASENSILDIQPRYPVDYRKLFYQIFAFHLGLSVLFFVFILWSAIAFEDSNPINHILKMIVQGQVVASYIVCPYTMMSSWINDHPSSIFLFQPGYSAVFAFILTLIIVSFKPQLRNTSNSKNQK